MSNMKAYIQHPNKVIETGGIFTHVMALTLDPSSDYKTGIARCITGRQGDVGTFGYVDRSQLYIIKGESLEQFSLIEPLQINGAEQVIASLCGKDGDFLGLEDPDIFIDEDGGRIHLYFTMPCVWKDAAGVLVRADVHLGHAVGKDMLSLEMTPPVLVADPKTHAGAKEVSIAPVNMRGVRNNLVESSIKEDDFEYSTVRIAVAENMGKPWSFGETVFHPKRQGISWIGGHASPGPLLPKSFIDLGTGRMLGIMNGREANKKEGEQIKYGIFSVGLFIYDYENGKIEWVSPEPLIRDSEARTITFASQFVETEKGTGILYAHVDDSFVRAYTLDAKGISMLLPK
jgi:hypothetical protein